MIGKLKGKIDSADEDSVILEVSGVGYHVFCASRTLAALAVGEAAELMIETHVREDHIHLFGFMGNAERDWFRLLTTVQGVGVKMALAILGIFAPAELSQAIVAKDTKSLTRVSGVGAKLAERITTELKNKTAKMAVGSDSPVRIKGASALLPASSNEEAVSALVNLGYSRMEAYNAVVGALGRLGKGEHTLEGIIKESLRDLMRK